MRNRRPTFIGIDDFTAGYSAAKLVHERAHLTGPLPAAVLRAAQFHEFVGQLVAWGRQGEVAYVPDMATQLVAARTVAEAAADGLDRESGSRLIARPDMVRSMSSIWVGERVRLRGVEPEEWTALMEFDQDSTVMRNADHLHPPRAKAGYRKMLDESVGTPGDDEFSVGIESLAESRLVGMLSTGDVDKNAGVFSYGITIGADFQRCGYASEAIILVLRYMFGERRFQKCDVGMYAYNVASLKLHEKLGFTEEGRRRRAQFFAGEYHDLVLMGMTVDEYAQTYSLGSVDSC